MLLASLDPAAVAGGRDLGDAVRIGGTMLSRSDLVGAATSVAVGVAVMRLSSTVAVGSCTVAGRVDH